MWIPEIDYLNTTKSINKIIENGRRAERFSSSMIRGKRIRGISFYEETAKINLTGSEITILNKEEVNQLRDWVKEAKRMEVDVLSYVGWCIVEHWS